MEEIINKLKANPAYDMDWINQAAWFIHNNAATEIFLSKFTAFQLAKIRSIIATPYAQLLFNPKFNSTQLTILSTCIEKGFDRDKLLLLANPDIPYQSMDYIAQGIEEGLDWSKVDNLAALYPDQCYEILYGYRMKIDYNTYASPIVPAPFMHMIATALHAGLDVKYNVDTGELLVRPKEILQKNKED